MHPPRRLPEVACRRKQEKPLEEIQRFHRLCAEAASRAPQGCSLPATCVEQTVCGIERIIAQRLFDRAGRAFSGGPH